jgi:hypothetical protein
VSVGYVDTRASKSITVKRKNLFVTEARKSNHQKINGRFVPSVWRCIRYDLINPPEMSAQDRGGANSRRVDGPASNRRENGDRSVIINGMEVREFD